MIVDDLNRRWRLPLGNETYKELTNQGVLRVCREVATERDMFSCMGTFYELPAENADGYAKFVLYQLIITVSTIMLLTEVCLFDRCDT